MSRRAFSRFLYLPVFMLVAGMSIAHAQPMPPGVVDAEEVQDWDKALGLYKDAIEQDPARADLWVKIAEIEASRNHPKEAERAMKNALKIKPDNLTWHRKHAELANWAGNSGGAEESYRAILKKKPKDYKTMLGLAEVLSWQGKTQESIDVLEPYVARNGNDQKALLLLSQLYMWNGQSEQALETLERYKKVAGTTQEYKKIKMQLLAASNQSGAAVEAADAVLKDNPRDCDALTTKAAAFGSSRQPARMLDSLNGVNLYCKDKEAAGDLSRRLTAPLRDAVHGRFDYSTDSDTIKIGTATIDGRYKFTPGYYLLIGAETGWLSADIGSGLETAQGRSKVHQSAAWIGLEKMVNDKVWVNGRAGYHDAGGGTARAPLVHGGAEYRPNDVLTLTYDLNYDLYSASPLSVSREVKLFDHQVQGTWRSQQGMTLGMKANYGLFSDHNRYWTLLVAPRQKVLSTQHLNVELGVSGQATGFSRDLTNGYYDPASYRQFMLTAAASYAFDSDNMIGVMAGVGKNKDNNMSGYERSNNYAVEGNFGLYEDWMLNLHAGHADSIGINSAKYDIQSYTANLTYRF